MSESFCASASRLQYAHPLLLLMDELSEKEEEEEEEEDV